MTFNLLSHIVQSTFLSPLQMHRKSTRERRHFQCVLENCLPLTGHLSDCGCLQKTGRTVSHQCLLRCLPRSPKEGGKKPPKNSGLVYFFPIKSFHFKNHFVFKIPEKSDRYLQITLFLGSSLLSPFNLNDIIRGVGSPTL